MSFLDELHQINQGPKPTPTPRKVTTPAGELVPFLAVAEPSLNRGWFPMPIMGKDQPLRGVTGYNGTVTPEKVLDWEHRLPGGFTNVAYRHDGTVAIDVDHGYGDKNGAHNLRRLARDKGLSDLPATYSSTARGDDSPSRQYFYRVPAGTLLNSKPCTDVEVCQFHHRFSVVFPSVHPKTETRYYWYAPGAAGTPPTWGERILTIPSARDLPELPRDWVLALPDMRSQIDGDIDTVSLEALMATFNQDGEASKPVQNLSDQIRHEHVGHDEFKKYMIRSIMMGREGHPGVVDLIEDLITEFRSYVDGARPGSSDREVQTLLDWCVDTAQRLPVERRYGKLPLISLGTVGSVAATDSEYDKFINKFQSMSNTGKLGRRASQMKSDSADQLDHHANCSVNEVMQGMYTATQALRILTEAYKHHGGSDTDGAVQLLRSALGSVLNSKTGR